MGETVESGDLIAAAKQASSSAYAPYSHFLVGAAVLTASGSIYSGSNVENIAHLSTHAEEVAIGAARLAEGDGMRLVAIAVYASRPGDVQVPCSPCGACRQRVVEFDENVEVLFFDDALELRRVAARDLLPYRFTFKA
jgi:cytidine deaminase